MYIYIYICIYMQSGYLPISADCFPRLRQRLRATTPRTPRLPRPRRLPRRSEGGWLQGLGGVCTVGTSAYTQTYVYIYIYTYTYVYIYTHISNTHIHWFLFTERDMYNIIRLQICGFRSCVHRCMHVGISVCKVCA